MEYSYYAVFKKSKEGGYDVTFPDIFGGVTCGDSFKEAKIMAEDLLKLMIKESKGQCLPPSDENKLKRILDKDDLLVKISINL